MIADNAKNDEWIKIKTLKKLKSIPDEIKIDMNGNVYINGEPYDRNNFKYQNLSIDVERHSRFTAGEETQKIIEKSKEAKRGETFTIKEIKGPDRVESTTVKF